MRRLPFEFEYGFRKVAAVLDTADELTTVGTAGQLLLSGRLEITAFSEAQPDPALSPVEMATLQYTYRTPDGGRKSYTVVQPWGRFETEFDAVLRDILPAGTTANNKHDELLVAVLALSDDGQKHRVPVVHADSWMDSEGWYYRGKKVCDSPVEIVSESKGEFSQSVYRLRVPRKDGNGFDYAETDFDGLNSGALHFGARTLNVYDPVKTGIALRSRYTALSHVDKERYVRDEIEQRKREHDAKLERMFLINGRLPNGRIPA